MSENIRFRLVAAIAFGAAAAVWVGCSEKTPDLMGPNRGSVQVTTVTTGQDLDPNGYSLSVDGGAGLGMGVNGTVTVSGLQAGEHELELTGVAANCTVLGSNPRTVTVTSAGSARTTFQVSCTAARPIRIVSGNDQQGKVGELLAEPFVVRVTDTKGVALDGVEVVWWTDGAGAFEGGFHDNGGPVSSTYTLTDADGLAQMSFMPTSFQIGNVWASLAANEDSRVVFTADARDPGAALAIASGSDQQAKAGQQLGEPFVVRVTDGQGNGVPHVAVDWRVTHGEGAFGSFGREDHESPVSVTHTRTGADGVAQVFFTPMWFGPIDVAAGVVGVQGSPVMFTADATDTGAALTIISGNDQKEGKAGLFERLDEPFVVRVTDGQGDAVPNVRVSWSVTEGYGDIAASAYSDGNGLARAVFSPRALGTSRVAARLAGLDARVSFMAEATVLVIVLTIDYNYRLSFMGPSCDGYAECPHERVPVGTTVEWLSHFRRARISSTSMPEGGASFDSGWLREYERFQFVASVAGTWDYVDQATWATGTLTAY